jgi:hypothetical protein
MDYAMEGALRITESWVIFAKASRDDEELRQYVKTNNSTIQLWIHNRVNIITVWPLSEVVVDACFFSDLQFVGEEIFS